MGLGIEVEEKKKWAEEAEDEGGVGGQENELFAHTINLIIKKLKKINRRVIDHLISSRSDYEFFWLWRDGGLTRREHCGEILWNLL